MSDFKQYGLNGCTEKCFKLMVFFLRQTDDQYRVGTKYSLYCSLLQANQVVSEKKVCAWMTTLEKYGLVSRDTGAGRFAWEGSDEPVQDLKKASTAWLKPLPVEK